MDKEPRPSGNHRHRQLRILFVSSDKFPPFRVDTTILFGKEMLARGHQIDWLLQSEEPCKHSYKTSWKGSTVWVGKTDNGSRRIERLRKHIYCIWHQLKLFSLLRRNHYDFIQVKNKYIVALAAAVAAKLFHTKFIYWLSYPHAEESLYKVKIGIARYPVFYFLKGHVLIFLMYKVIMPLADHVFVQSEKMKKDVALMGVDEGKLTPVPMGVSLESFEQCRVSTEKNVDGIVGGRKSIVYLGTIQRARRMDFMVRVLDVVLKNEPDTVLYFVGDGEDDEDRHILKNLADKLGISGSIIITGFLSRSEAMEYVRNADVCVSPFCPSPILDSTSPTKLIEYMAMGKPVVANDHPEQRLVLEESNGGICVPYEEEAFAQAILEILGNPEMGREMGTRGRQYVEEFRAYDKIVDFLDRKYLEICST